MRLNPDGAPVCDICGGNPVEIMTLGGEPISYHCDKHKRGVGYSRGQEYLRTELRLPNLPEAEQAIKEKNDDTDTEDICISLTLRVRTRKDQEVEASIQRSARCD